MGDDKIRIDLDEVRRPEVDQALERERRLREAGAHYRKQAAEPTATQAGDARVYGRLESPAAAPGAPVSASGARRFWYSAMVYMAGAGFAAALFAWIVTEPFYEDFAKAFVEAQIREGGSLFWAKVAVGMVWFSLVSTAVGLGLGAVEGLVKRTMRAALIGGLLGAAVGCIGGGLAGGMAQVLYDVLGSVLHADKSFSALVTVRSIGWGLAGMVAGISQGAAMQSVKRVRNGLLGGLIGGLIGGALFDPIVLVLRDDVLSRMVALCAIGTLMGAMIGWIENVLKDAWLHVTAGPLAGKQFVIYRNPTMFGSSPKADIYLFKDPHIEPRHAALHSSGQGSILEDLGTPSGTFVNGERIQRRRLRPGDVVTIGQYAFAYDEKARRKLASPAKT